MGECTPEQLRCGNRIGRGGISTCASCRDARALLIASKEYQTMKFYEPNPRRRAFGVFFERFLFVATLVALSTCVAFTGCQSQKAASAPPAPEVQVVAVVQQDVPIYNEWVATLDGYVNARTNYTCRVEIAPGANPNNARTSSSGDFASVPSTYCDGTTAHSSPFTGLLATMNTATMQAMFPPGAPRLPSSFSLTFTTPGRFEYWCLIHADVGAGEQAVCFALQRLDWGAAKTGFRKPGPREPGRLRAVRKSFEG